MQTVGTDLAKHLSRVGLAALFLLAAAIIGLRFAGVAMYAVMSGSMAPAIPVGSLVVVRSSDPGSVSAGDVITFELPDRVVTHRVVAIDESETGRMFVTKGDANAAADLDRIRLPKAVGLVQGVVPGLGYAVVYAHAYWRPAALAVAAAIFLVAGSLLVLGRAGGSDERRPAAAPRRAPAPVAARRPRRLGQVQDELWTMHLSWVSQRQEVAA